MPYVYVLVVVGTRTSQRPNVEVRVVEDPNHPPTPTPAPGSLVQRIQNPQEFPITLDIVCSGVAPGDLIGAWDHGIRKTRSQIAEDVVMFTDNKALEDNTARQKAQADGTTWVQTEWLWPMREKIRVTHRQIRDWVAVGDPLLTEGTVEEGSDGSDDSD